MKILRKVYNTIAFLSVKWVIGCIKRIVEPVEVETRHNCDHYLAHRYYYILVKLARFFYSGAE